MTENDFKFTRSRTVVAKRRTIMCISESGGTSMLEKQAELSLLASLWAVVMIPTTHLI